MNYPMRIHLITCTLFLGLAGGSFARKQGTLAPTHADVAYDTHQRTVLDFWQAQGDGPRPLLVYIHGGGWEKGDKRAMRNAGIYLEKGISVAAINYRLTPANPLPAPVHDAARAVQFLRSRAEEWNIDKNKVVVSGGSAGGCSSLWIACHDDLADPGSDDPVQRESTRVQGAGVLSAQTSIDPKVIEPWIGPNVFLSMIYKAVGEDSLEAMRQNYARHEAVYEEFSPINHLSKDDPPLFLEYPDKPEFMALPATSFNYGIHHGMFGIKMKEQSIAVGHEKVQIFIKDHDESRVFTNAEDFVIKTLLAGADPGGAREEPQKGKPTTGADATPDTTWTGKKSSFQGFEQVDFMLGDVACKVVVPSTIADGKPWVLRARFWGHEPQFDLAMLGRGYHVVYCDVRNLFGNAEAVRRWNELYNYLRFEHLFADRAVLEGMSRGGLIVYNWAAANPDKVAAIYADAPVMDFKSWPGGKGKGSGAAGAWATCLQAYGLTEEEALAYQGIPLENLAPLAKAGVPIIHVVGDTDKVVPVAENTAIAEARYKKLGGVFEVIHKPEVGHHPHSLEDPQPIVTFVTRQDMGVGDLPAEKVVSRKNFILRGNYRNSRIQFEKNKRGHVAFIGGSITEMEGYRPMVCEMLEKRFPVTDFTFTNAGISSTCSDTGAFRLQRDVLSHGPLDMLFVEFAVNDDQDADQGYEDALRGMEGIIAQARKHNPQVDIVMTMFVNERILAALQAGETRPSVAAHSKVAERYGISVNHLAQELADLISAGKMDWKKFGGVHPNKFGNAMCATMISNALLAEWGKPLSAEEAVAEDHLAVEPIDPKSYTGGRLLPFEDVQTDAHWKSGVPDWPNENKGKVRPRFRETPMIYSSKAGAKLTIAFSGTAIGAYLLAGPDTCIVRCTVDGKETREIDTLSKYSGFNYPTTVMFFNELDNTEHSLELEILDNRSGRSKLGGTALRVLGFTANEKERASK